MELVDVMICPLHGEKCSSWCQTCNKFVCLMCDCTLCHDLVPLRKFLNSKVPKPTEEEYKRLSDHYRECYSALDEALKKNLSLLEAYKNYYELSKDEGSFEERLDSDVALCDRLTTTLEDIRAEAASPSLKLNMEEFLSMSQLAAGVKARSDMENIEDRIAELEKLCREQKQTLDCIAVVLNSTLESFGITEQMNLIQLTKKEPKPIAYQDSLNVLKENYKGQINKLTDMNKQQAEELRAREMKIQELERALARAKATNENMSKTFSANQEHIKKQEIELKQLKEIVMQINGHANDSISEPTSVQKLVSEVSMKDKEIQDLHETITKMQAELGKCSAQSEYLTNIIGDPQTIPYYILQTPIFCGNRYFSSLQDAIDNGTSEKIIITKDLVLNAPVVVSKCVQIVASAPVSLCRQQKEAYSAFLIEEKGSLLIEDNSRMYIKLIGDCGTYSKPFFVNKGVLQLKRVVMSNCVSPSGGSCVCNSGEFIANESIFTSNLSDNSGGAICSTGKTVSLTSCTFCYNTAKFGGAISLSNTDAIIERCLFETNIAKDGGAVVIDKNSHLRMSNTNVLNCKSGPGGSSILSLGKVEFSGCNISNGDIAHSFTAPESPRTAAILNEFE